MLWERGAVGRRDKNGRPQRLKKAGVRCESNKKPAKKKNENLKRNLLHTNAESNVTLCRKEHDFIKIHCANSKILCTASSIFVWTRKSDGGLGWPGSGRSKTTMHTAILRTRCGHLLLYYEPL